MHLQWLWNKIIFEEVWTTSKRPKLSHEISSSYSSTREVCIKNEFICYSNISLSSQTYEYIRTSKKLLWQSSWLQSLKLFLRIIDNKIFNSTLFISSVECAWVMWGSLLWILSTGANDYINWFKRKNDQTKANFASR